ncbi:cupin domain-containing protein [Bordetella bronchialis]|uniref:Cupin n=1 Tax=Bordetella bronchialis TaxID=463025 RepID=A0A193FDN4_9BORD|nr:cupin domain-containing protein [Bordetella bronchialis]ANN65306.1 cupin [Bordetella bronchialis]ANN70338.1 cupin [Bordetella bronchialis]
MTTTNTTRNGGPKPGIFRPSELTAYERGGGARTIPLVTAGDGATAFINGITEFAPGTKIPFHSHNCEESVMLLEGDAILDIDGEEHRLQPMDTTWIPPNVSHRFRNMSDTQPMKILWIYASVNATRTLTETGVTNPVALEHIKR